MATCPQCRALNYEDTFHRFLAKEYVDAQYGAVHHLTVAAYMLQHPDRLSQDGWRHIRESLRIFLVEGRSPQEHRARIRKQVDSGNRDWSLKKGPRLTLPPDFEWSRTIVTVDDDTAEKYCEHIEAWARAVLADAESL